MKLWVRIVLAGILCEVLYGLYLQFVLGDLLQAYALSGMLGVVVLMALGGIWVGFSASSKPALNGGLVGIAAIVFYFLLLGAFTLLGPEVEATEATEFQPGLLVLNHALKIVGGLAGGFIGGALRSSKPGGATA